MQYHINGRTISYHAEGERAFGEERFLLHDADDLTRNTGWTSSGFSIEPLFDEKIFKQFHEEVSRLLIALWKKAGLLIPQKFLLEQYHTIARNTETHLKAVNETKLLQVTDFPLGIKLMEERISDICKINLQAKNPFDQQEIFHFRVIRPLTGDNNPLHRDVWLEDYSDCINLYIPVCGSNENSSLIIVPGSHHWQESKVERTVSGALINGVKFNVPAVTSIKDDYKVERPSPELNEVLVFSPYLIHGGAVNLNPDTTRISIELRLWRKP